MNRNETPEEQVFLLARKAIKGKFRALANKICSYDRSMCLDDLVQGAVLYFLEHKYLDRFSHTGALSTFVYTCCYRYLLWRLRGAKTKLSISVEESDYLWHTKSDNKTPLDELLDAEEDKKLDFKIELAEKVIKEDAVLSDIYFNQRTRKDKADEMGVSRQRIHQRVFRAKKRFNKYVSGHKTCKHCQQSLPLKDFYVVSKKTKSGDMRIYYRTNCKKCQNKLDYQRKIKNA